MFVYKHTETIDYVKKSGLLFKKIQNNPSSFTVKNAKFSGYCFYMNPYISRNF